MNKLRCSACWWRIARQFSNESRPPTRPIFITTPIYYMNAKPHLGHIYTTCIADTFSRWHQFMGHTTFFTTGADEHGIKVQQAAAQSQVSPQTFCDSLVPHFQQAFRDVESSHDVFIRTTSPQHKTAVQAFWRVLQSAGYLYRGRYEGWYSTTDECFYTEQEVRQVQGEPSLSAPPRFVSISTNSPVVWVTEENWIFRLSAFKDRLRKWLTSSPHVVHPNKFTAVLLQDLDQLQDLSVSRPHTRLSWGIPVPDDPGQTIYVWLDALVNYLTVCGYPHLVGDKWPACIHFIGKDILKFHAIYWPAFLMAVGLPLPRQIVCHSHWLVDNVKMSKSLGNSPDTKTLISTFTGIGLRMFLLRDSTLEGDNNFSTNLVKTRVNQDLANTLGNFMSRCLSTKLKPQGGLSWGLAVDSQELHDFLHRFPEDRALLSNSECVSSEVQTHMENYQTQRALETVMLHLRECNTFLERHTPWNLVKQDSDEARAQLAYVLNLSLEQLRICATLLLPFLPSVATRVLDRLQVPEDLRNRQAAQVLWLKGDQPVRKTLKSEEERKPLFVRIP